MVFVKRHLFLLICGAVGVAAIGVSALGIRGMNDIPLKMQAGVALETDIRRLSSGPTLGEGEGERLDPINAAAIEARKANIAAIQENHDKILATVTEINKRPMLMEAVFPTTTNVQDAFSFKTKYEDAMAGLLVLLDAGAPPTTQDVKEMGQLMDAAAAPKANERGVLSEAKSRSRSARDKRKRSTRGSSRRNALTEEEAGKAIKEDPAVRAAVKKAKSIRCYASPSSFDRVSMPSGAPRDTDMWHAQMTYLVQRDIVEALARVNEAAAIALAPADDSDESGEEDGEKGDQKDAEKDAEQKPAPWVGVLPVKDLLSIQVGGGGLGTLYVGSAGEAPGAGRRGRGGHVGGAPLAVEAAFTQRGSTALYDVIRFTVRVIVDSRDVLLVLNEINKSNFYVPFNVNYVAARSDPKLKGKIYGSEPTVELRVDFDGYFFRNAYLAFMPPKVKTMIGAE